MKSAGAKEGFTLLETLVAITILIMALLGPLQLASRSVSSVTVSQNRIVAFYLAQEGVEVVRNIRDYNFMGDTFWLQYLDNCLGLECYIDIPTYYSAVSDPLSVISDAVSSCGAQCPLIKYDGLMTGYYYNYVSGKNTIFRRSIKITSVSTGAADDEARVEVKVFWKEKNKTRKVELQESLFNWKP